MNKIHKYITAFAILPFLLSGCARIGEKSANTAIIYGVVAVISLLMLAAYTLLPYKKDPWFLLLYSSVLIVNVGYFALSLSASLEEALLANRISYLGSVFLPISMIMIILNLTGAQNKKHTAVFLLIVAVFVFLVAASPGYLDIYYKEAFIETVNGGTVLRKVYGPWHILYLIYLVGCFTAILSTIIWANVKKKIESNTKAVILTIAVTVNLGVWLLEQLVSVDFELLSVSYIISEMFLLALYVMINETEKKIRQVKEEAIAALAEGTQAIENTEVVYDVIKDPEKMSADLRYFRDSLTMLTPTEHTIYNMYNEGLTTKEIMRQLNITENTLKFHNKNLYGKLGVSSRKQLMELSKELSHWENTK